jgi:hypothetical protein
VDTLCGALYMYIYIYIYIYIYYSPWRCCWRPRKSVHGNWPHVVSRVASAWGLLKRCARVDLWPPPWPPVASQMASRVASAWPPAWPPVWPPAWPPVALQIRCAKIALGPSARLSQKATSKSFVGVATCGPMFYAQLLSRVAPRYSINLLSKFVFGRYVVFADRSAETNSAECVGRLVTRANYPAHPASLRQVVILIIFLVQALCSLVPHVPYCLGSLAGIIYLVIYVSISSDATL